MLRKAAARSVTSLWNNIGDAIGDFGSIEAHNYFRHYGYLRSD